MGPQQIVRLAQAGQTREALSAWSRLSRKRPNDSELLALGGNLHAQSGDLEQAGHCFKEALAADERNVTANTGMGRLLRDSGDFDGAVRHLRAAAQARPDDLGIANLLALCLRDSGRPEEAADFLEPHTRGGHPGTRYNFANLLLAAGRFDEARGQFQELVGKARANPALLNGLGLAESGLGRLTEAINAFESALAIDSNAAPVLANLARAYEHGGRLDDAANLLRRLVAQQPGAYEPRIQLANVLREQQQTSEAIRLLTAAIAAEPDRVEAYRDRVAALEESNRLDEAESALTEALERHSQDPELLLMSGRLARRRGDHDMALEVLSDLHHEENDFERRRSYELAQACEALGKNEIAWNHVLRFNELTAAAPPSDPHFDALLDRVEEVTRAQPAAVPPPVFMVGLPRSGTTLLGRILGAHSEVQELEEQPFLAELARKSGWPGQEPENPAQLRNNYLDRLPDTQERRVVDRNPVNLVYLPLIRTIWPEAPIVFCQRHAGDICVSCLFQDFRINWLTQHFRRPESTVATVERLLARWFTWLPQLDPAPVIVRYEDLVADPDKVVSELCEALDLPFEPGMIGGRTAGKASRTASYAQISEAIHQNSVGRWLDYRDQLPEELAKRIEQLSERLGYQGISDPS
ncbi:MAG: tetratricopeptide repeat protein [Xanthomonadales bacterium]|nr:tetratricopeptide repeat protein [Xanthomonadales bacterium]